MSTEQRAATATLYGIGNPLMDIIVRAEAEVLQRLGAPPGSMNLVTFDRQRHAIASGTVVRQLAGGSCANTIRGARWLLRVAGSTAGASYTGGVGRDREGDGFDALLEAEGVTAKLARKNTPTGSSVIIVTPDSQRTMFTYLGACRELQPADVDLAAVRAAKILHMTGYMWDTPNQEQTARAAAAAARRARTLVSFDVADRFVVDRYRDSLVEWIPGRVDILFANESELTALTGVEAGGRETLNAAGSFAPTVVMKTGPEGCLVLQRGRVVSSPAHPVDPTDTTGAGDAFAGGYLFGMVQKQPAEVCASVANRLAGGIVVVDGCNYDALDPAEIARVFDGFV
jgi:sugar/nucleoside kinase (ribokinase family)